MCFAKWQCPFYKWLLQSKMSPEKDCSVPSLSVRAGCDGTALLWGWWLCRGSKTALLPEPRAEQPGPFLGL